MGSPGPEAAALIRRSVCSTGKPSPVLGALQAFDNELLQERGEEQSK